MKNKFILPLEGIKKHLELRKQLGLKTSLATKKGKGER